MDIANKLGLEDEKGQLNRKASPRTLAHMELVGTQTPLSKLTLNADGQAGTTSSKTLFGGTRVKEIFAIISGNSSYDCPSKISTQEAIDSLLKFKENKRVKPSTLETYKRRLDLFQRQFLFLPEKTENIMDFLSRFGGETGRHRRNYQDLLNMLYKHAVRHLGLPKNPLEGLERPIVTHKPIRTLSLEQVRTLNLTPETIGERTALDLMLGHGWRQVDVRRILAADVRNIDKGLIWCGGKERDKSAPILPETAKRLRQMAHGLKSDDHVFLAEHTRDTSRKPLGEDGMAQLVHRLLRKAKLRGFTGHDLRRTFATLVTAASGDEFLAMQLLRDTVPGLSNRYIQIPMSRLTEALEKYSPLRLIEESSKTAPDKTGETHSPTAPRENASEINKAEAKAKPPSLLETEEISKTSPKETGETLSQPSFEAGEKLVETGIGACLKNRLVC